MRLRWTGFVGAQRRKDRAMGEGNDEEEGSEVRAGRQLHQEAVGFRRAALRRVGNEGAQKVASPDEEHKGTDELAGVENMEQDEEDEHILPKEVDLQTRRAPDEGNEEEEPKTVGKNDGLVE